MSEGMIAFGTQVYRQKNGLVKIVPPQMEYKASEDEVRISEVRDIDLHFPVDGAITADIEVNIGREQGPIMAHPKYFYCGKEIASLVLANGEKVV